MSFNLADTFELAVDTYPDRECLIADGKRCTFAQMEARANRLAHYLAAQGIGKGDHVGIYAYNCMEWVETLWAVFKLRAVWININYRYVEDELAYLVANADLKALVFAREFAPLVAGVLHCMPRLEHLLVIEDGSGVSLQALETEHFEAAMAQGSPLRDFARRSDDDRYILYTGGTTGMPKGVVWRHEDVFFALGGGIDQMTHEPVDSARAVVERGLAMQLCFLPIAPLMHGASQWAVMSGAFEGRKTVLMRKFDPAVVWQLVEQEKVSGLMITGDAMARPLIESYEAMSVRPDVSSLFILVSSAAIFSATVKDDFFRIFPELVITDSIGASESGGNGLVLCEPGKTAMKGGPTVRPGPGTVVLDEESLLPMAPGTGKVGKLARSGYIPLGYYRDPEKTAATWITGGDGKRYTLPGDHALLEADGSLTMLGRGSVSINSGGEKIYPEEVEAAVKSHPAVYDCIVVGVPDERWGSRVVVLVQPRPGQVPTLAAIQQQARKRIAGYKIPRQLQLVKQVQRSPSGKPDYRWATAIALGELRDQ